MKHILSDNNLRFIYTWRKSWDKKNSLQTK